jgi:chitinase
MMNGRSDAGEYFRQADFQTVLDYATSHHLARYTYWSVNRDRQCPDPNQSTTSGTCSSVPQGAWDFTKYTARFAGATPPTSPPTNPPPTTTPPGTCSAPAWTAGAVFTGGQLASYNGHIWKAQWWTQGETPGTAQVWLDQGACSGTPTTAPPGPCGAPAWVSGTAYVGGSVVSYNGHKWTAKWWTQGDVPGANSQNVWTDDGPC